MPNLQEIVNKIFGLDPTKDYDFTVNEKPPAPVNQQVPPTVVVPPTTPPAVPENSTVENNSQSTPPAEENSVADIASMQARIKNLEAANLALLNRLPVQQQEEKSTEELLYELYMLNRKGAQGNGIRSTSNRTEHGSQSDLPNRQFGV